MKIEHNYSGSFKFKKYDQDHVKITFVAPGEYTFNSKCFDVPGDNESISLNIKEMDKDQRDAVYGKIVLFNAGIGKVCFSTSHELQTSVLYSIKFEGNRNILEACLRALERVRIYGLTNFFTKFDGNMNASDKRKIKPPSKWFNKKICEDSAQKNIVLKILSESSYPFPFVITGGPGTGKTSVVVETILQILDKKSFAHVLVTCQSNSACDEVAMRLRKFVPSVKVFRYWGPTVARKKLDSKENRDSYYEKLQENSSIRNRSYEEPMYGADDFKKYKVVIATMTTVDRMIKRSFPNNHFDFIFVDECCAATEPECLIPITGLGMERKKVNANVILIGDDKLLGPVLNSPFAVRSILGA